MENDLGAQRHLQPPKRGHRPLLLRPTHVVAKRPAGHLEDDAGDPRSIGRQGIEVGRTGEDPAVGGDEDAS